MHHTYDVEVEADRYDDLEALRQAEEEGMLLDDLDGHDDLSGGFNDDCDDVPF